MKALNQNVFINKKKKKVLPCAVVLQSTLNTSVSVSQNNPHISYIAHTWIDSH